MSESIDAELGKTLDIYRRISIALNAFPRNEKISVEDLARKAGVHWNTAKKAVLLFATIDRITPKFQIESKSRLRIIRKPSAIEAVDGVFESLEMRILVKLMLQNATEEETAQKVDEFLNEEEKRVLQELISKGFINSIEGRFYLSRRGQSLASIGLRELVELGIELPWEKSLKQARFDQLEETPEKPYTYLRLVPVERCLIDFNFTRPTKHYRWQPPKYQQGWQSYRDKKRKTVFCTH